MVDTIECPYCRQSHAVKVWFVNGFRWNGIVTTDQNDDDCMCNVYVCPQCGRVSLLDVHKEKSNGEKVNE